MQTKLDSASRFVSQPPRPDFIEDLPPPRKTLLRRRIKQLMFTAIDHGWFGLQPLRTHVVVCGFTRSGSTLLLLMAETCVANAKVYGTEVSALSAAQYNLRNHPIMITKDPGDVFFIDEIRAFYASRRANARFVLTLRDPRAVLTSKHEGHPNLQPGGYYETPEHWLAYYKQIRYAQQFEDVITVEYKNLVNNPHETERQLTDFIGWDVRLPFAEFHTRASPDFGFTYALNGLRRSKPTRIASWRRPEHRDRLRHILRTLPELPEFLIEMGYESDLEWARDYL